MNSSDVTARLCHAHFLVAYPLRGNASRREGRSGPAGIETRGARLREARDLTQEERADRAGLHPNYIGRIERGESNVGVKALFKLARGLGVSPAALFER